jgi:2-amino-4-hydroxy-6-hydroxymethyldihydropteridine diphosphokinase
MKDGMNEAFLGLGGNEGDRLENLSACLEAIERECGQILMRSGVYETEAWGLYSELKFLNQVIQVQTKLGAKELLVKLLLIEQNLGRKRSAKAYADRPADIDILFMNTEIIDTDGLQIPHPRLHLRKFVLMPLHEIAPNYIHPVLHTRICDLLAKCEDTLAVNLFKAS